MPTELFHEWQERNPNKETASSDTAGAHRITAWNAMLVAAASGDTEREAQALAELQATDQTTRPIEQT